MDILLCTNLAWDISFIVVGKWLCMCACVCILFKVIDKAVVPLMLIGEVLFYHWLCDWCISFHCHVMCTPWRVLAFVACHIISFVWLCWHNCCHGKGPRLWCVLCWCMEWGRWQSSACVHAVPVSHFCPHVTLAVECGYLIGYIFIFNVYIPCFS